MTTENPSSSTTSNKTIDSNIVTQQDMASEINCSNDPTSSTETTEDRDTEDTDNSNTTPEHNPHKRSKLQAIKTKILIMLFQHHLRQQLLKK